MQKNNVKIPEQRSQVKKEEDNKIKGKNKKQKTVQQKPIDEQNSDGSAGAFKEFIDQHREE